MKNNEINDSNIRNIRLPLAATKPDIYKKLIIVGLVTFYMMSALSYLTNGFLTHYIYLELAIIVVFLFLFSNIYDYLYRNTVEEIIDSELTSVIIGFSNKVLILSGEDVLDEVEADEIKIRQVNDEEEETFYSKYTTVLDCFKDGELVTKVGIGKIVDYEGLTLKADMSRADEDLQIVYDDEIDPDSDDWDIIESLDELPDIDDLSKFDSDNIHLDDEDEDVHDEDVDDDLVDKS